MEMKLICLESPVFHSLIEEVVDRLLAQKQEKPKWISGEEAMDLLRISSKSTLQRLRDEGQIRFSQPMKKHIVYDRQSLLDYLDFHAVCRQIKCDKKGLELRDRFKSNKKMLVDNFSPTPPPF